MNTTLITGASSGIGEAFARQLAARGHNLLLVARSEDKLINLCNELGRIDNIPAHYVAMDLSEPDAPARLFAETQKRDLQIDFLINNAGFGSMGDFTTLDLERALNMILNSADRQRLHLVFARDAAEIWVKALLQLGRD